MIYIEYNLVEVTCTVQNFIIIIEYNLVEVIE